MPLKKSTGNMYEFVTHTWNPIKGKCSHDCSYCYVKRWGELKQLRLDEKELSTDLGKGNFIFVGSGCDMFASDVPKKWILKVLDEIELYENKYLFQSKNPMRFLEFTFPDIINTVFCTTIETNRHYKEIMNNAPAPDERAYMMLLNNYITVEPIMDFDLLQFLSYLQWSKPKQVNIGADSGRNGLPEPSKEKIRELISELEKFTKVHLKKNLNRLIK